MQARRSKTLTVAGVKATGLRKLQPYSCIFFFERERERERERAEGREKTLA